MASLYEIRYCPAMSITYLLNKISKVP